MSEKPKEKPWQDEIRGIIRNELRDQYLAGIEKSKTSIVLPFSESKVHQTLEEIATCPNCHKEYHVDEYDGKIKARASEELVKALKERGHLEYECKECGTGETETEARDGECPTCHGKTARRRS